MNEQLKAQLIRHEGVRSRVYRDSRGYNTIGVGRNVDVDGGLGLSVDEIEYLLNNDVNRCFEELMVFPWFQNLDTVRRAALINMLFNLGLPRLLRFERMIDALMKRDFDEAALEALDSRWAQQVGQRAIEVAEMIKTGDWPKGG